jgi:ribosomal protein L7/L12
LGKIILCGWNLGFNKVALTKLLRAEVGYSLPQAKSITDAVADRQSVTIEVADDQIDRLAFELNELGAKFRVDEIDGLKQRQYEAP